MEEQQMTKGEQTNQDILTAARRLFLSQGFTATPMRQIAREVGITPAAIYNHYRGKDQLFTAVLQNAAPYDELFALWDRMDANSAESLVHQMFRAALTFVTDHQDYLRLALIDAQERDGVALAAFLPEMLPRSQLWYQRLVALDAASGQAQLRDIPFLVFARTMVSLLVGFVLTQQIASMERLPQLDGTDWAEALADLLLYGMLKPADRDQKRGAGT